MPFRKVTSRPSQPVPRNTDTYKEYSEYDESFIIIRCGGGGEGRLMQAITFT